jgi:DNA-binding NarL/FixJ family response regulator
VDWLGGGITPDIVILDIQMPHMNGEETAKWIGINSPDIKILVLSMYDDELNIIRMLRVGAVDGYRDEVFVKLGIKSRIGLALYALRNGMVKI